MFLTNKKITFLGGGQMAEAIFSGLLKAGAVLPQQLTVVDISGERVNFLTAKYGLTALENDRDNQVALSTLNNSDIVVLSIKPQMARGLLQDIASGLTSTHTVISIMGGITLSFLEELVPNSALVRVMPNMPMLVSRGVAGLAFSRFATDFAKSVAVEIFQHLGTTYVLPEKQIDALTSISGCGPAFAYLMIEAMSDAGVELGLPRDVALGLAAQTLVGAGEMVLQTGRHPAQLKDAVCSPAGGTIAGIHSLEDSGFRAAAINAVCASYERMIEVGKKS